MPNDIKIELELTSQDDGEFWMCYRDFRREYCNMIICNLSPDFDHDGVSDKAGNICTLLYVRTKLWRHEILSPDNH